MHSPVPGSSPLTRGKPSILYEQGAQGRLIPAHAGKTGDVPSHSEARRAHPRSRGENNFVICVRTAWTGSSPLTRGKHSRQHQLTFIPRLIPAHAGKTWLFVDTLSLAGAHPRSRGENGGARIGGQDRPGSSPLTRGKRVGDQEGDYPIRLIPAHAGKTYGSSMSPRANAAHPRSRGENRDVMIIPSRRWGSSPLTRGKHAGRHAANARQRLIPAHAGKTWAIDLTITHASAHPRSRGENTGCRRTGPRSSGSSPLTRGKHWIMERLGPEVRLIPAHAGKTGCLTSHYSESGAHPRSRGENRPRARCSRRRWGSSPLTRGKLEQAAPASRGGGSSPLTRGKPDRLQRREQGPGLIPAHAGKTRARARGLGCRWAHPRSRGENQALDPDVLREVGSSPLTRGKQRTNRALQALTRLIPAHAGKTPRRRARRTKSAAHPRSRGENLLDLSLQLLGEGSSPLTRGKLDPVHHTDRQRRLIPAHAGKTSPYGSGTASHPAHPRSRGENLDPAYSGCYVGGSSPLTRGKQRWVFPLMGGVRLIPAHAGKTAPPLFGRARRQAHPRSRGENALCAGA